jgi:putative transcriptional regulator
VTTHPNRSRAAGPASNPRPDEIRAARAAAGLGQSEAAELIYASRDGWAKWEAGERRMHPGLWALFRLRTGQHPSASLSGDLAAG